MPNYLKLLQRKQVIALLDLGWSYRRIQAETGVRRETISRYDRERRGNAAKVVPGSEGPAGPEDGGTPPPDGSNAAKTFPGSGSNPAKVFPGSALPDRSAARAFHNAIVEKMGSRLSLQRIWQDLVEDYGYGHSYESIKRYVRTLPGPVRVVGVMYAEPGEEAQVDFFQGVPTLERATGQWRRPWVFRMTLAHSRHGYEEAVWEQKLDSFLALHENAFRDLGGVPRVVRHDNLKAAVVRACLYDPDVNEVYTAFARHWGFTPLPTRPRNPRENGKQERSGGYVKDNALKGRRFDSLEELNAHLQHWNRAIARLRIHGTTRRQVYTHFLETDKPALSPLPAESFAFFESGTRTVHPDGHVEVRGGYYPVPAHLPGKDVHLLGKDVRVRWDKRLVRVYFGEIQVAVHTRVAQGTYAPSPGGPPAQTSSQKALIERLLGRCGQVGAELRNWAEQAHTERGVRAIRLIQGALALTRTHPKERVLRAARLAAEHRLFRLKALRRLAEQGAAVPSGRRLIEEHPAIRPMTQYSLKELP
ncbi:MAG: IS21 family transposase [Thermoanaerobaculia bacterium]